MSGEPLREKCGVVALYAPHAEPARLAFFALYALDMKVGDAKIGSRKEFEDSMKSHILEKVEYMGKYQKAKK